LILAAAMLIAGCAQKEASLATVTISIAVAELVAAAACFTDPERKWKVKLVKQEIVWDWVPRRKCPAAR